MSSPYGLRTPCSNCPFRTDIAPYITEARVREIEHSLVRSEFPCHKTVKHREDEYEEEGLGHIPSKDEMHCAGALILMEREERSGQMMRIAERLGLYDPSKLDMAAPVYASFDAMAKAHGEVRKRRPARSRKGHG